jgi:N6-L-threonylcarbamoyladenine synthase
VARDGNACRFSLPPGLQGRPQTLDFSFSGLKTAVLYHVRKHPPENDGDVADLAASFQETIVDVLVERSLRAVRQWGQGGLGVVGGVACNRRLRSRLSETADREGIDLRIPGPDLCTDNAAMVAGLGGWMLGRGEEGSFAADAVADVPLPVVADAGRR